MADMNSREFLAEIEQITGSLRRDIEAKSATLTQAPQQLKSVVNVYLVATLSFLCIRISHIICGLMTIKRLLSFKATL